MVQLHSLPKGALCSFDVSQLLPQKGVAAHPQRERSILKCTVAQLSSTKRNSSTARGSICAKFFPRKRVIFIPTGRLASLTPQSCCIKKQIWLGKYNPFLATIQGPQVFLKFICTRSILILKNSLVFSKNVYAYSSVNFIFLFLILYTIPKLYWKIGLICAILTSYCFRILKVNITDEDSDWSQYFSLELVFFQ